MFARLPFLLLTALTLCTVDTTAVMGAAPSTKALNLHLSDLPRGFTQTRGTSVSNVTAAKNNHVSLATLQHEGRIVSYETGFSGHTTGGFIGVLSGVTQFKTSQGARQDYILDSASTRQAAAAHARGVSAIPFTSIGDARVGIKTPDSLNGKPIEGCVVMFHRSRYWAIVLAYTLPNRDSCTWAGKYAHLIDTRIQHA